ncbi:MAG: hypothetical protein N3A54_05775 [Patescibacteria group bacterium]|nr:hypothetical protein [Patescibacteria group bacterium]
MIEQDFSHDYVIHIDDWTDLTARIRDYISQIPDGEHRVIVVCDNHANTYNIVYKYGETFFLVDEAARLEVLRVDRYTDRIPSFRTQPLKEERVFIAKHYPNILRQGLLTAEMQSHANRERVTFLSPSKLLGLAIKKIAPNKLFGGFLSLWQPGDMGTNYDMYRFAYRTSSHIESEDERKKIAAASTITGRVLKELHCVPVYISDKKSYVAVLFKKN